jgi:EAL domain-containing protein (putative c-di-GMP-specific phosphodiesterase class I)
MAAEALIRCTICGGEVLFAAQYVTRSAVVAPALRCARCAELHLSEAVARSDDERASVRIAKAERAGGGEGENAAAELPAPSLEAPRVSIVAPSGTPGASPEGGRVLLVDDDDLLRAAHARMLRKAGWEVVTENSAAGAQKRFSVEPFDVIVTDLVMPGMGGLELLRLARQYDLDVPVVILTGHPDLPTAMEAMQYGAFRYVGKPVAVDILLEVMARARDLHTMAKIKRDALALLEVRGRALGDRASLEARFASALDSLWVAYQPIVAVEARKIVAYEGLVRTGEPTMQSPLDLFDVAERLGKSQQVSRKIRAQIAADSHALPNSGLLFVNVHPEDLTDGDLLSATSPLSRIADRVVLEVTERASLDRVSELQTRVAKLRSLGFQLALDDLGAGYAGLTSFTLLQPDYVKLDASLIQCIDKSPQKRSIVQAMLQLAGRDLNLKVISEGVETVAEQQTLLSLGAQLLQGYLYARPSRGFVEVW